ncbi:MAG: pentapeptide repeat-containing protein [Alphaproteobacteria bacterium]
MNHRINSFKEKNAKTFSCGEKGLWESLKEQGMAFVETLKKDVSLKDLNGKTLYSGKAWKWQTDDEAFQKVFETAVKDGKPLPKLDASNRIFNGLTIPNAKISGASFENSEINPYPVYSCNPYGPCYVHFQESDLSNSDLNGVCFKNTAIAQGTKLENSDVTGAVFEGEFNELRKTYGFLNIKNLDKAKGIKDKDLKIWQKSKEAKAKKASRKTPVNIAQLRKQQTL